MEDEQYRCLSNYLDRRNEYVDWNMTLDRFIAFGIVLFATLLLTGGLDLVWRLASFVLGMVFATLITARVDGLARYERLLLLIRGLVRQYLTGRRLTPDQLAGTRVETQDFLVVQRSSAVRLRRVRRDAEGAEGAAPPPPSAPSRNGRESHAHPGAGKL